MPSYKVSSCVVSLQVYRFISKTESLWRANATRNASMIFDGLPPMNQLHQPYSLSSSRRSPYSHPQQHNQQLGTSTNTATTAFHAKRPTIYISRLPPIARTDGTGTNNQRPITLIRRRDQLFVKKLSLRSLLPPGSQTLASHPPPSQAQLLSSPLGGNSLDSLDVGAVQEVFSSPSPQISSSYSLYSPPQPSPAQASNQQQQQQAFLPLLPDIMEPEFHQLGVRIQHLNIRVKDSIVTNPNGCCIFYGRYDEMAAPTVNSDSPNATSSAPDPIEMAVGHTVAEANRAYVEMLLNHMVRGITVTASSHDGSIYVERSCRCAVFVYYMDEASGEYVFIKKVVRRECAQVFDYSQFATELEYYRLGQGPKPHHEVVLAFGQQLRPGIATYNLLLWCRIASCRAWFQVQRVSTNSRLFIHCFMVHGLA